MLVPSVGPVFAAAPPTVVTDNATDISTNNATFHGEIANAGGEDCNTRGFVIADASHPDPGDQAPPGLYDIWAQEIGSFSTGAFSLSLSGITLDAGTRYYYRAYAHNSAGYAYGNEVSFLTKPVKPSNLIAVSAGDTQLDISWTKGDGADRTCIVRKVGSAPLDRSDGDLVYFDTGTSFSDTGLTTGTHYYYSAWSEVTAGPFQQYSDNSAGDNAIPGIVLPSVTTLEASGVQKTAAKLNGAITATGGEECNRRGFSWGTDSHGDPGDIGPSGVYNKGSYTQSGSFSTGEFSAWAQAIDKGTLHYYRACARNTAGWKWGDEQRYLTRPDEPSNLTATVISNTQIDLSWNKGDAADRTVIVRKAGSAPADINDGTQIYLDSDTTYSDTGLTGNTHYFYRAWSEISAGGLQQFSKASSDADATPPETTVDTANPDEATRGDTLDITITGTLFTGATIVDLGAGIAINSFTVDSDTQITANVSIAADAAQGTRDIAVTSPSGTGTGTDLFTVVQPTLSIATATGSGTATFSTNNGSIINLSATASPPCGALADYDFPHGTFSYSITGIPAGSTVTITITLPSGMTPQTEYWKCQNGEWINCTSLLGDNDSDNTLTLTITDGGPGDADGTANGVIADPGGPAYFSPGASPAGPSSVAPSLYEPSPTRLVVPRVQVRPRTTRINQPVTVYANMANRGETGTAYTATLKINGIVEESASGTVSGNMAIPLEFEVVRSEPGTYTVEINGQQSFFTVMPADEERSDSAALIAGFILCCVSCLVFVAILVLNLRKTRVASGKN